jgi:hypothetical protein
LYPAWENIDHGERGTANVQELRFTVDVEPFPDAVEPPSGIAASIRIRVEGTDRVPCKLEFVLDPGGMLVSPFCAQRGRSGGSIFLRSLGTDGSHEWTYTKGLDSFRFAGIPGGTPPFHGFDAVDTPMEERLRGEADADAQGYSIYIGSHTPFAGGIDIR